MTTPYITPPESSAASSPLFDAVKLISATGSIDGNTYYTPQFIRDAAREFEGCPSYADHQATPSGSIRNVVGRFQNVRATESNSHSTDAVIPSVSEGSALSSSPFP